MIYQRAKPLKTVTHTEMPVTKQVNVTDLTPNQRSTLFKTFLNQAGFIGVTKNQRVNGQTYYIFHYKWNF